MTIYDIFFFVFSLAYLPYLVIKGKAHKDFSQRFGKLPEPFKEIASSHPIWIHAVSVGEVMGVKNFTERLGLKYPNKRIVLSTTTRTGNDIARKVLDESVLKFYFPVDFSFIVKRVTNLINPSILIIMETEIWPNLILEMSKRKTPVALINGRISDRSFKGYRKIKFFFKDILERISIFCMRSDRDAENIKSLGAPEEKVKITGNMKFDVETDVDSRCRLRESTTGVGSIGSNGELLIAGSTHGGEEEIVLDVYKELVKEFKDLRLLIAPRHIDRSETIKKMVEHRGHEAVLLSQFQNPIAHSPKPRAVLILDTLGELSKLYSLATIVFMGGSLIKRGGHNLVEPAVFSKPIVFGPHMFNFKDLTKAFLEKGAAIKVKDRNELFKTLEVLLRDKTKRDILGRNARELIERSKGATLRNINEIAELILI